MPHLPRPLVVALMPVVLSATSSTWSQAQPARPTVTTTSAAHETAADAPVFVTEGVINAPVETVWKVWSTADGYKRLGPQLVDIDLRIGGLIRSKYEATGTLGDDATIINRILAFEPQRMMAIAIDRPPAGFPFKEAWKHSWTVISMATAGPGQTHLRVASMGFGSDPESVKMRQFFEAGNAATLKMLQQSFAK